MRTRWLTLLALVVATVLACGKIGSPSQPESTAGGAGKARAGGPSDGGQGDEGGRDGVGGAGVAGRGGGGGSGGMPASSGTGNGGRGGGAGMSASGGNVMGTAGSTTVPGGWSCELTAFDDGKCDCGCGAGDSDCERTDRVNECERCACAGGCPGRVDPEDTTRCLPAPNDWTCGHTLYGDGRCDCGCGVVDLDCDDESVESCEICGQPVGGCANGPCPSNVVADDNTRCFLPDGWLCETTYYGNGSCDCGCGVVDLDCDGPEGTACAFCPPSGCADDACLSIDPADNTVCTSPPPSWKCPARLYHDGSQCDCGCGFRDPDCSDGSLDACDKCNDVGSCSGQACPGTVNPNANERCEQPEPPEGWTCNAFSYGDGAACDCGCGVPDVDCRTDTLASCVNCGCGSRCPDSLDPNDVTKCLPPPAEWTCAADAWNDFECDCGCGIRDPACGDATALYCSHCSGCSEGDCARIDPDDNAACTPLPAEWTCDDALYFDNVCDCGCGALDRGCASTKKSDCDFCNSSGSCSALSCLDGNSPIKNNDNAHCN